MASAASSMSCGLRYAVAVAVDAHHRPGRGDELHRPDRTVDDRVVVELARVGVGDLGGAVAAVERDAVDAGGADALVGQRVAAVAAVVGLDAADRGDQGPVDVAGGVGGVDHLGGALVGRQRRGGDAVGGRAGHDLPRRAAGDAGGDLAGRGDAGRGLDRLAGDAGAVGQPAVLGGSSRSLVVPARLAVQAPGEQRQRHECRGLLPRHQSPVRHRSLSRSLAVPWLRLHAMHTRDPPLRHSQRGTRARGYAQVK